MLVIERYALQALEPATAGMYGSAALPSFPAGRLSATGSASLSEALMLVEHEELSHGLAEDVSARVIAAPVGSDPSVSSPRDRMQ